MGGEARSGCHCRGFGPPDLAPTRSKPNRRLAAERGRTGVVGNTGSSGMLYSAETAETDHRWETNKQTKPPPRGQARNKTGKTGPPSLVSSYKDVDVLTHVDPMLTPRDTSATPPRHLRDTSATPPRHLRDTSATPPRHLRDTSATPRDTSRHLATPRDTSRHLATPRDTFATRSRHVRDISRHPATHPRLCADMCLGTHQAGG